MQSHWLCRADRRPRQAFSSLLGVGQFANPLAAHVDYEADERVISLITRGIGQPQTAPVVEECCTWLEVGEDLR